MTFDELDFATYCIGNLSLELGIPQPEIYRLLNDSGLLKDYIIGCYDSLHTFDRNYIVQDVTSLMRRRELI